MKHLIPLVLTLLLLAGCGSEDTPPPAGNSAAKISKVAMQAFVLQVQSAAKTYKAQNGKWPESPDDLIEADLLTAKTAVDPWGNPWDFKEVGTQFVITSFGVDGEEGGSGADADRVFKQ